MLLSFLKFPFPVLRHRIFFRVSTQFSFVYARQLVEEGVRQNPAFVQNGENVAKTGQIGDIVPPDIFGNFKNFRSNRRRFGNRREKKGRRKGRRRPYRKTRKPLRPRRFGG